jgi:hypothetical protein
MFAAIDDYIGNTTAKNTVLDKQLKECISSQVGTFTEKLNELTENIELNDIVSRKNLFFINFLANCI